MSNLQPVQYAPEHKTLGPKIDSHFEKDWKSFYTEAIRVLDEWSDWFCNTSAVVHINLSDTLRENAHLLVSAAFNQGCSNWWKRTFVSVIPVNSEEDLRYWCKLHTRHFDILNDAVPKYICKLDRQTLTDQDLIRLAMVLHPDVSPHKDWIRRVKKIHISERSDFAKCRLNLQRNFEIMTMHTLFNFVEKLEIPIVRPEHIPNEWGVRRCFDQVSTWLHQTSISDVSGFPKNEGPLKGMTALEIPGTIVDLEPVDESSQKSGSTTDTPNRHKKNNQKPRHKWDGVCERCAKAFKKTVDNEVSKEQKPTPLNEFCQDFAAKNSVNSNTLYKKMTEHRQNWDPDREYGGRRRKSGRNGHS